MFFKKDRVIETPLDVIPETKESIFDESNRAREEVRQHGESSQVKLASSPHGTTNHEGLVRSNASAILESSEENEFRNSC